MRFGIVEPHQFAGLGKKTEDGKHIVLGVESSERIWAYLKQQAYIDSKGKVQDSLREVLKNNTPAPPEEFEEQLPAVKEVLRKLAGKLTSRTRRTRRSSAREAQLHSEEFKALGESHQTEDNVSRPLQRGALRPNNASRR
ncbi:MAG: hypothetical protein IPL52_08140 [Flavobacteriales bacterium]|nr:hypothetical protein [Flavobacteriales bacterium]